MAEQHPPGIPGRWHKMERDGSTLWERVHIRTIDGKPEAVGYEIWGTEPPGYEYGEPVESTAITGTVLRTVRVAELVKGAVADFFGPLADQPTTYIDGTPRPYSRHQVDAAKSATRRVKQRGRDGYVEVAEVFAAADANGESGTTAVGEAWGIPKSTATTWVSRARTYGLLPAAQPPVKTGPRN